MKRPSSNQAIRSETPPLDDRGSGEARPLDLIGEARVSVDRARKWLLRPTPAALGDCHELLTRTGERLQRLKTQRVPEPAGVQVLPDCSGHDLRQSAQRLEQDLVELRSLLEQAGAFYLAWSEILLSATGTYSASGELTAPRAGNLLVRG